MADPVIGKFKNKLIVAIHSERKLDQFTEYWAETTYGDALSMTYEQYERAYEQLQSNQMIMLDVPATSRVRYEKMQNVVFENVYDQTTHRTSIYLVWVKPMETTGPKFLISPEHHSQILINNAVPWFDRDTSGLVVSYPGVNPNVKRCDVRKVKTVADPMQAIHRKNIRKVSRPKVVTPEGKTTSLSAEDAELLAEMIESTQNQIVRAASVPPPMTAQVQAWRDQCECHGGPHGGYTCERCR